ncbi:MAG: radical SAM protein [Pelosinus sp.]|nr:radical SAM protein [Pelosinus sp.]
MKHYIIPIFIPHYGCKHQCVFCNQRKITGLDTPVGPDEVANIIDEHLAMITKPRHVEAAFYGGSFTALPLKMQTLLLQPAFQALKTGKIHAIRLSTRPDAITPEILKNLLALGVSIVELGVQSLDEKVLILSARGHSVGHVVSAAQVLREYGFTLGIQVMPGLPGEDMNSITKTASRLLSLKPDIVRIYPTLVIADTRLAKLYQEGKYLPLTINEAVRRAAFLKLLCENNKIKVIRTGLQATEELANQSVVLAGPYHPSFGELVDAHLFDLLVEKFISSRSGCPELTIHYHWREESKVRGQANANTKKWKSVYGLENIVFVPDGQVSGQVVLEADRTAYAINKIMLTV